MSESDLGKIAASLRGANGKWPHDRTVVGQLVMAAVAATTAFERSMMGMDVPVKKAIKEVEQGYGASAPVLGQACADIASICDSLENYRNQPPPVMLAPNGGFDSPGTGAGS